jgi:hypothetical protein
MKTTREDIQSGMGTRFVPELSSGEGRFEDFQAHVSQLFLFKPQIMQEVRYLAVSRARQALTGGVEIYEELIEALKGLHNTRTFEPYLPTDAEKFSSRSVAVSDPQQGIGEADDMLWAKARDQATSIASPAAKSMIAKGSLEAQEPYRQAFPRLLAGLDAYDEWREAVEDRLSELTSFALPTIQALKRPAMKKAYAQVSGSLDQLNKRSAASSPWDVALEAAAIRTVSHMFENAHVDAVHVDSLNIPHKPIGSNLRFRVLEPATPGSLSVTDAGVTLETEAGTETLTALSAQPYLFAALDYAVGAPDTVSITLYWDGEDGLEISLTGDLTPGAAAATITAADAALTCIPAWWDTDKLLITVSGSEYLGITGDLVDLGLAGFDAPQSCGNAPDADVYLARLEDQVTLASLTEVETEVVETTVTYEGGDLRVADPDDVQAGDLIQAGGAEFPIQSIAAGLAVIDGTVSKTVGYPHLSTIPFFDAEPAVIIRRSYTFTHTGTAAGWLTIGSQTAYNLFTTGIIHGLRLRGSVRKVVTEQGLLGYEVGDVMDLEGEEVTISATEDYAGAYQENSYSTGGTLLTFSPGVQQQGDRRLTVTSQHWTDDTSGIAWSRSAALERTLTRVKGTERAPRGVTDRAVTLLQQEAATLFSDPTDLGVAATQSALEDDLSAVDRAASSTVDSILSTLKDNGWTKAENLFVSGMLQDFLLLPEREASYERALLSEMRRAAVFVPGSHMEEDATLQDMQVPLAEIMEEIL